ncbi:MAG: hypothetical protein GAK34_00648 [Delftia tsuruhatensis]|nr:MAG: hypothetical protein GAK34_00648 [Delftia tsuruhatensis]
MSLTGSVTRTGSGKAAAPRTTKSVTALSWVWLRNSLTEAETCTSLPTVPSSTPGFALP